MNPSTLPPSFDTWTSGFLIAVAMGLFIFLMLLMSRNKRNLPIAFVVLGFSTILFSYVLYWTRYDKVFPYLVLIPSVCYYATGPLFYLYFLNLYKRQVRFNYALHFLPACFMLIPNVQIWLKYAGITSPDGPLTLVPYNHWLIAVHMTIYLALIALLVRKNSEVTGEYTVVRHRWSRLLLFLYALFIFAYVSYYALVNFSFFNSEWDYMISFTMTISIYAIGYFIFRQPRIFDGELYAQLFLPVKNKDASVESALTAEFYEYLTGYMAKEKPYLDNELRLVHLADKVGFSTHLLSRIINEESGKNFNQFINDYRLEEAEKLMFEDPLASIKTIYFDVGFNNKATFYKAFRNRYGCTPSEFRKQLIQA